MSGGPAENLRGAALLLAGDVEGAIRSFTAALVQDSSAVEPRFNRAIAWLRLGNTAEASADLESLWGRELAEGLRASIAYHRALAADRAGNLAEALQWIDRAIQLDPHSGDALLYAGLILEKQRRFQDAGQRYRAFLDRNPDSVIGMLRFGVAAHRAGHRDLSRKYLWEVVKRAPDSREATEARKFLVMWE